MITKVDLLKQLLSVININFNKKEEIYYHIIQRDVLLNKETVKKLMKKKKMLKSIYHSDMLTCLHSNSEEKQRFPGVCMLRQLLKTNNMHLRPKVESIGYDTGTGKKLTKRYYIIIPVTNS